MLKPILPRPDRLRTIPRSFAWIDHRLRRDGHLALLRPSDMALYLFLALAADARGLSFQGLETISRHLGHLPWADIHSARARLLELDLIGFQPFSLADPNGFYQVLSLDGLARPGRPR